VHRINSNPALLRCTLARTREARCTVLIGKRPFGRYVATVEENSTTAGLVDSATSALHNRTVSAREHGAIHRRGSRAGRAINAGALGKLLLPRRTRGDRAGSKRRQRTQAAGILTAPNSPSRERRQAHCATRPLMSERAARTRLAGSYERRRRDAQRDQQRRRELMSDICAHVMEGGTLVATAPSTRSSSSSSTDGSPRTRRGRSATISRSRSASSMRKT
jgi:hypothetical protein